MFVSDRLFKSIKSEAEFHLNSWLLPIMAGTFAVLYAFTGFRGWLIFFIGTAGAWLLAWLWVHSLKRNLHIERKLHLAWATVGDSVHEQLKLVNHSWLPAIWVEIFDTSDALMSPIRMVSDVPSTAHRTRHITHLFRRRGLYTLGPTRLRTGDPLGIYTLTLHDHHSDTILIIPPVLPLTQLKIPPAGWAGDQQRRRGSLEREISSAGVRGYLPGDSLRRIHWSASAHFDGLMVRQLEATASEDWWIFVDLDGSVQAGTEQYSTLELSIILAASLAARGLKEHRRVGLAFVGKSLVWLEPRADAAQRWRILQALAMAEAGTHSLAELLAVGPTARTATCIMITPSSDPSWIAAASRSRRGSSLLALLVDPMQFDSPTDLSKVTASLAYSGIPYTFISRSLLDVAYPSSDRVSRTRSGEPGTRRRYLKQGRTAWQSMD
jgi:uncharacterized protein (DUF58 family)